MAKKNNSARKHSSPGLYFTDTVVNYATKSLGITSLGVVGETLRGRAFEPMTINDWGEFIYNFGGKSTEKYRGSQYPKYELPYIAQSYLEQSHNLKVVRVLGLSGVNAGPAWVVTAHCPDGKTTYKDMVVLVIRSRGEHQKAAFVQEANPSEGICEDQYEYDGILYYAKDVNLIPSKTLNLGSDCNPGYVTESVGTGTRYFTSKPTNYGTFTLQVTCWDDNVKEYSVTLNPNDKNYIYKVIGGEPEKGDAEIYVEELYDVALRQLVNEGEIDGLNQTVVYYENVNIVPAYDEVYDILTDPIPTRSMAGRRYLYSSSLSVVEDEEGNTTPINVRVDTGNGFGTPSAGVNGVIYTVYTEIDPVTGKRSYFYGAIGGSGDITYEYALLTADEAYRMGMANKNFYTSTNTTSRTPQTVYNEVPQNPTSTSPEYIAVNMANSKVLSVDDSHEFHTEDPELSSFSQIRSFT
ncbi:MAG: hypothetical protein J6X18_12220, partial [Bacteroidales bacterium]|nr:hypothetical protein [Bacteroidales bacterium]